VIRLLKEGGLAYAVICQHNFEHLLLSTEEQRANGRANFHGARWVAFVADGNRRKAERELGATIPNAILVKNPVNLTDLSLVPWPKSGTVRFACVARLEAGFKGQDLLFEVLNGDRWKDRDWRLRLYGAGVDRAYLERVCGMYGLDYRVEFAGHLNDVRGIWADNHLQVLPCRSEGTPLSLVEAMLCGRAAVVTDVGGNAEWVTDSITGFIAEAPSARSFTAAMERAWNAKEHWSAMGVRAHEEARQRIDPDAGGSLIDLIEKTVNEK